MRTQQNAASNAVQAEPCPTARTLDRFAVEDMANEALSISLAVDWLTQANVILSDIRTVANSYPSFREQLLQHRIKFNAADWSDCEMDQHISRILQRQMTLIRRLRRAAGALE